MCAVRTERRDVIVIRDETDTTYTNIKILPFRGQKIKGQGHLASQN